MKMNAAIDKLVAGLMLSLIFSSVIGAEMDGQKGRTDHGEGAGDKGVEIADVIAARAGIKTAEAGPGEIDQTLTVYGRAVADSGRISHMRARFPGTITRVAVNIGDPVEKGAVLAEIESNESLKRYVLRAPFDGVITARHATQGELTKEQALLTLSNFDKVWAEFQVFPGQVRRVAVGQTVRIRVESEQTTSRVEHLIPNENGHPFVLARAIIDNRDGRWTPGLLLEGKISVNRVQLPLVVDNRALHKVDGGQAVFVKDGNSYRPHPLKLGKSDGRFTEVLEGLHAGDEYAVENSYLIKADLEKSGASHDH